MSQSRDDLPRAQGILRFDWEDVQGRTIRRVLGLPDAPTTVGMCFWEIVIVTDGPVVHATVNPDTDEVIITLMAEPPLGAGWVEIACLFDLVGRDIGWAWSCINSQGYWDLFILSARSVTPDVALVGMASSLHIMRMNCDPRGEREA